MAITSDLNGKQYTLGRGKLFFDRFSIAAVAAGVNASTKGEGERYFGNTPGFSMTSSAENLDHYDSDGGVKTKDDSVQLQLDRTGSIETDNISGENIALLLLGTTSVLTTVSGTGTVEVATDVKKGLFYQLGTSPSNPTGVRKISNLVVKKGAGFTTTVAATNGGVLNYEVDEDLGRVFIPTNAPDIVDGTDDLQFTYDVAASTRERIVSSNNSIYGALRYIADNPKGTNRDVYMPYVKLAPDGDYALKGDDWMKMTFTFEALKKGSLEAIYIDGRAV